MIENCICILVPTVEKNRALAEFTRKKSDDHWPGHPTLLFCGRRGEKAREDLGPYHHYGVPYPLFRSGIMKKGCLNADLIFFLRWDRRHAQLAELQRFFAPPSPAL
jgi:hypothetical protein